MDPIGSAASIITVLHLTADIVKYLIGVTSYPRERRKLREEIFACESILSTLQDHSDQLDQPEDWQHKLETLEKSRNTPLHRLFIILDAVKARLQTKQGLEKVKASIRWPFNERELQMLLQAIERDYTIFLSKLGAGSKFGSILIKAIHDSTSNNEKLLLQLRSTMEESTVRIETRIQEVCTHNTNNSWKMVLEWLSPVDHASQHTDVISRKEDGTGQWLLQSAQFQSWRNNAGQTLFCPGIPGAGKTILTSIVIEHLNSHFRGVNIGIAYVYCNYRRIDEQTTSELLAQILKQLAQSSTGARESLVALHSDRKGVRLSVAETLKACAAIMATQERTFVLVDALDECHLVPRKAVELLELLFGMQKPSRLNIFATSRFIPEIVEKFTTETCRSVEVRATEYDIRKFLKGHMSQLSRFVQDNEQLQDHIAAEISNYADGMFLLAQISFSSLEDKLTPKSMRKALEQFRKNASKCDGSEKKELLSHAYRQAMERINSQKHGFKMLAKQVMSWIICAKREMTTVELQHAIAIEPDEPDIDRENIPEVHDMISACAGLVNVDKHTDVVRLVHYTLQEYLEDTLDLWFPGAAATVTKACVTYLSLRPLQLGWCPTDEQFEARLRSNPLYDYAARFWGFHGYGGLLDVENSILEFLRHKEHVASANQAMMASPKYRYRYYSQRVPRHLNGMHIAAYFGLDNILKILMKEGLDPNSHMSPWN